MTAAKYDSAFYAAYADQSRASASAVLTIVNQVLAPRSVVDVGCGIGTWLSIWMDLGVQNFLGIDGRYVRAQDLLIPQSKFQAMDLTSPDNTMNLQFDLVESLEVAEHLPKSAADGFVSFLCSLGPVVLFSAAIPYQGGVGHVNEQWPEYWAELFRQKGYEPVDAIRPLLWNNPGVAHYYAQNALIFVRSDRKDTLQKLRAIRDEAAPLSLVHPGKWHERNEQPLFLGDWMRMFPKSMRFFVRRTRWNAARRRTR
jgi:SAM-dependent methyltransferase